MFHHLPGYVADEVDERAVDQSVLQSKGPTGEGKPLTCIVNIVHTESIDESKNPQNGSIKVVIKLLLVRSDNGNEEDGNCTHQLLYCILLKPNPGVSISCEKDGSQ